MARESLKKSIADSPARNFERYPAGSIVLCNACALPVFKLDAAIALGDGGGRAAKAFKPVSMADLDGLIDRDDVDAGVRASITAMSHEQRVQHLQKLHEFKSGDPMLCPACGDCFVQVLAVTKHEVLDRAYTMEMLVIKPSGSGKDAPVRGRYIGYGPGKDWVH
jgi:hypothetical protein